MDHDVALEAEQPADRVAWRFPSIDSSVPALRRGLNFLLRGTGLSDDELYDLVLAACEAASNAIEHARYPREPFFDVVTEIGDGQVTIVLRDHGQWREPTASAHRGRGLAMMQALAHTAVVPRPHGTTVTLRSRRAGAAAADGADGRHGAPDGGRRRACELRRQ